MRFQALQEQEVLARFDALVARMAEETDAVPEEEARAQVDRWCGPSSTRTS